MLAPVVKLNRSPTRSQVLEALTLPEFSEELIEAERRHAEITVDLAAVRADFETLNMNFNLIGLRRGDGTLFPSSGREAELATLFGRCADLEAAKEKARRGLEEARRAFSESASKEITPAADALCEAAIGHIDQVLALLERLEDIAKKASAARLTIKNPQILRAAGLAHQLYAMRGQLAPSPQMGVRR